MGLSLGSNAIKQMYVGSNSVRMIYLGSTKVWPAELPVYEFYYTGEVQSVELPAGRYKLECWGAQGGDTSSYSGEGSYGGYSEGILTLTETTTLYVFVGGQGGSSGNGGWNGGGSSTGYSSYSSGNEYGESWPACGGGATDIATVTSSMNYSSGRTNRSSASLLSRIIVAGGGAGASARYTEVETTTTNWVEYKSVSMTTWNNSGKYQSSINIYGQEDLSGKIVKVTLSEACYYQFALYDASNNILKYLGGVTGTGGDTFTYDSNGTRLFISIQTEENNKTITATVEYQESTTTTSSSNSKSDQSQQGGGTSGRGTYGGSQSSAGSGGAFGLGANQTSTNYRYAAGGGGGGWYGGGTGRSDSSTGYIDYTGGGSGFVNTAANSSYRPSGYTGLQLDSGSTTAGQNSGDGYAKITALGDGDSGGGGDSGNASISWTTSTGTWNESSKSAAADGKSFTCVSPGDNGSTVIRCTFSGVTSITFTCVYNGESDYDYLAVGNIDSSCTRDSYGTTLKGTSGTAKDITFTCDTGTHYVEFCYSKDGSVNTNPDNATVYCKNYS